MHLLKYRANYIFEDILQYMYFRKWPIKASFSQMNPFTIHKNVSIFKKFSVIIYATYVDVLLFWFVQMYSNSVTYKQATCGCLQMNDV